MKPVNPANRSEFLQNDPIQIEHLLQQLIKHTELVCLYPGSNSNLFGLSALLAQDQDALWFDPPADRDVRQLLLGSRQITAVGAVNRVQVQFELPTLEESAYAGRPALRGARPGQVLSLQRRDSYRLHIPLGEPVRCSIPVPELEDEISLFAADISAGGLSLLGIHPDLSLSRGQILRGCKIHLPGCGLLVADLCVQSIAEQSLPHGITTLRSGCAFVGIPAGAQSLIMRYINRVERQRLQYT